MKPHKLYRPFVVILLLCLATSGFVHRMRVEASVESGARVIGSAHYHDTPVVTAEVRVIAPDGKVLLKTKTNAKFLESMSG